MDNVYAPIHRAEEIASAFQQCSADYNLTPFEQSLVNTLIIGTIRQVALSQVADNLLRPYTQKLNDMCPYREHSFNMSIKGTIINE